jgi:hypothetical protein
MSTLKAPFRMTISGEYIAPITLTSGEHFRLYPSQAVINRIDQLTAVLPPTPVLNPNRFVGRGNGTVRESVPPLSAGMGRIGL